MITPFLVKGLYTLLLVSYQTSTDNLQDLRPLDGFYYRYISRLFSFAVGANIPKFL